MNAQTATPAAPTEVAPATPPPPPPPPAPLAEVIKIGDENKRAIGKITDLEQVDNQCYITLLDSKGKDAIEIGLLEFCSRKPSFKGKKVHMEYKMQEIQASSCYGDPKCKKRETVALVVAVKEIE